jgi:hypothetical protein
LSNACATFDDGMPGPSTRMKFKNHDPPILV